MKPAEVQAPGLQPPLYRTVVDEAMNAGQAIMETLIRTARRAMHDQEASARTVRERQRLVEARQYLNKYESVMVERYSSALHGAFLAGDSLAHAVASATVHFDQLELMDDAQVMDRVELARAEQVVMLAVEPSLAVFNPVMCAAAGFSTVRADRNPVRAEIFVRVLQTVVSQMQLSAAVREDLMWHMSDALGKTLAALYARLTAQLQAQGVQAAGYAVRHTSGGSDYVNSGQASHCPDSVNANAQPVFLSPETIMKAPPGLAADVRANRVSRTRRTSVSHDETLLTLEKLRKLLSGELDQVDVTLEPESFAAQFSREFDDAARDSEPAASDFHATVPAAFEALKEMRQIDQVIERISTRKAMRIETPESVSGSLSAVRSTLRHSAQGLGQALSLEVVTLMVDNIANDERLLGPVQDIVKSLEPALLRLALVDPRFFIDKLHPARCLLQEITHRSLAYDSVDALGFSGFLEPLQRAVGPLAGMQIEGAQPFEQVLDRLVRVWDELKQPGQLEKAMEALQHAEERNLLAEKFASEIQVMPAAAIVPAGLVDFLCGPWAQVLAHARMADSSGVDDPGRYRELVFALLWSAQPELTGKNIAKLTKLVPKLLGKLREGLGLIDYPSLKTSSFFELLMNLHQQAFRSLAKAAEPPRLAGLRPTLFDEADPWVAPAEVKASGFMELPEDVACKPLPASAQPDMPASQNVESDALMDEAMGASADTLLPVGSWVELLVKGSWVRTQLSWASPHGTMFLFTSAYGNTQSMTRRSRDKLLAADTMRIVSGQPVVEGALDAVVQTAMLNSIDIRL